MFWPGFQASVRQVIPGNDKFILKWFNSPTLWSEINMFAKQTPFNTSMALPRGSLFKLKSQNATSNIVGRRTLPFAFTEHYVLMLTGGSHNMLHTLSALVCKRV